MELKKERGSHVAMIAEQRVFDAKETCVVEGQNRTIRSTVSVAMNSVTGNVLDEKVVAGHMQKPAMRMVVHILTLRAVLDVLLKNGNLKTPIATFVPNYAERKQSDCIKDKKDLATSRKKDLRTAALASDSEPSDDEGIPSKEKKPTQTSL